mgnify:CR=1 FL=1
MAIRTDGTTTTATTRVDALPSQDSNNVGLFVTASLIGYKEPSRDMVTRIHEALRASQTTIPPQLLQDLITIKLLAPNASKDVMICAIPSAMEMIATLKDILVRSYSKHGQ